MDGKNWPKGVKIREFLENNRPKIVTPKPFVFTSRPPAKRKDFPVVRVDSPGGSAVPTVAPLI
jgi:hypothetical protein